MVYYDSNSDGDDDQDDDSTFYDAMQVDSVSLDSNNDDDQMIKNGETINNDFNAPIGFDEGATGITIEMDGVLHAQYCHCGDIYYQPIEIYGDNPDATDEAIEMMQTPQNRGPFAMMLLLYKDILS